MLVRLLSLLMAAAPSASPRSAPAPPATMRLVKTAAGGCSAPFGCVSVVFAPTPEPAAGQVWVSAVNVAGGEERSSGVAGGAEQRFGEGRRRGSRFGQNLPQRRFV